jgi:hypothetical protein
MSAFISLVRLKECDRWNALELGAPIEDRNLQDEEISNQFTSELLDERSGSSRGAT